MRENRFSTCYRYIENGLNVGWVNARNSNILSFFPIKILYFEKFDPNYINFIKTKYLSLLLDRFFKILCPNKKSVHILKMTLLQLSCASFMFKNIQCPQIVKVLPIWIQPFCFDRLVIFMFYGKIRGSVLKFVRIIIMYFSGLAYEDLTLQDIMAKGG